MGWRYHKSVKLPLGFRLNFSKSGMGWSWGVKGARVTKMANGKTRYTATYPGGLQYIEERGPKQRKPARRSGGGWNTPSGPEPPKKRSGCLKWGLIVFGGMVVITMIGQALGIIEPEEDATSSAPESSMVSEISSAPESSALPESSEPSEPEEPSTPAEPSSEPAEEPNTPEPSTPVEEEPSVPSVVTPSEPVEEPPEAPAEEPQAVLSFTSFPSSVSRNSTATVSIHGQPNTDYSITVYYKSGAASADGLETKTSDANGNVTWSWKIGAKTSTSYQPSVTVSGGGEKITAKFTVTE